MKVTLTKKELMEIKLLIHGRMADESYITDGLPLEVEEIYNNLIDKIDKCVSIEDQIKLTS